MILVVDPDNKTVTLPTVVVNALSSYPIRCLTNWLDCGGYVESSCGFDRRSATLSAIACVGVVSPGTQ